jgi:hypothetical protein
MVDSIGRHPVGRSVPIKRTRANFVQKKIQKMEQWRDKARINLFQQRERYKQKVKSNRAMMNAKKACRSPNLNPSAVSVALGNKPKSREYGATHSTVPLKPRYSIVKPAERIFGNRWAKWQD